MSLYKLIGRIEQGFIAGRRTYRSTNNWTNLKAAYEKNRMHKEVAHSLSVLTIRERNGSRGEGIGMGHHNRQNRIK